MTSKAVPMPYRNGENYEVGADITQDGVYRYALWRTWNDRPKVMFIGLNPSIADATIDDPTLKRCIAFARSWDMGGLFMLNLYAFIATHPEDMDQAVDPIGHENDNYLLAYAHRSQRIVACWGDGIKKARALRVLNLMKCRVECLGQTMKGNPRHPLYVKGITRPETFRDTTPPQI